MAEWNELERLLSQLDGQQYGAYRRLRGWWGDSDLQLSVDRVQGDPFAAPSIVTLRMSPAFHCIPTEMRSGRLERLATCDFLLRTFAEAVAHLPRGRGSGKSGRIEVDAGGAEILERAGAEFDGEDLEVRFRLGLPAQGRRVLGREAARLLCEAVPRAAEALRWHELDTALATTWVHQVVDHAAAQKWLHSHGLVAFVADGSVLPRASGVSSDPLPAAVPFSSPESLSVELPTQHFGAIRGMGIPVGITLIAGGGFHGKTTLLEAVQSGVYPHVPDDGREWVVTVPEAVKVRSEDGRAVEAVDIRWFVSDLPGGRPTDSFCSRDASGSTSLAASILESVELGAKMLVLDEDTCATNLLVRDARMAALVRQETLTPLVERIRELREAFDVSFLLVVGGCGDYLDVADHVLILEEYIPRVATDEARAIALRLPRERSELAPPPQPPAPRRPVAGSIRPERKGRERIKARGTRSLGIGHEEVDMTASEQLVDPSQLRAVGALVASLGPKCDGRTSLRELAQRAHEDVDKRGLYAIAGLPELARPRGLEIGAALNRLRTLRVDSFSGGAE